jgi:hypothetical protein
MTLEWVRRARQLNESPLRLNDSVPRTVAGVRRAWRKRRRRLVRREAQLRSLEQQYTNNLASALQLRSHNLAMGVKGQSILDQSRSYKAKMLSAQVAATRRQQRLLLASLSASLLLLLYAAWGAV